MRGRRYAVAGSIPLRVNETISGFDLPAPTLTVRSGVETFAVLVPASANGRHGVAIDGGAYNKIEGVDVAPGHSTSITAMFNPGTYKIYDPHGDNATRGYSVTVKVTKRKRKNPALGKICRVSISPMLAAFLKNARCGVARGIGDRISDIWPKQNYSWDPISAMHFNCEFSPFVATGLTIICRKRDQRITFSGYDFSLVGKSTGSYFN